MKKILDFIKSNIIVVKWTIWYFFVLWLILQFVFGFNMFSTHYWWKFFHATLHGFTGFVFGMLVYTFIPVYIATTIITYRKKEFIIKIPFIDKVVDYIYKLFPKKEAEQPVEEQQTDEQEEETKGPEYPSDMPPELRIPYTRVKNNLSLTGAVSVYNKQPQQQVKPQNNDTLENDSLIPIPTDFDISESLDSNEMEVPMFRDITFDEPEEQPKELENNTTKYFSSKKVDFETYKQFVATEKYVIYEHNDGDFWIMDEDVWFAAGKQLDSPVKELTSLAKQNGLIPVIYLQSQNIMDIESTTEQFEKAGIRVIKSLDELK